MSNQHDSTWKMRAPDIAFQALYATGPTLTITTDANSSGRWTWLLDEFPGHTSLKNWPIGPWQSLNPGTQNSIVSGTLPARYRIEALTGVLTLKSTCP
jgi:hypothetical protein